MTIDTGEVLSYIKSQEDIFEITKSLLGSDFNNGILQGLALVKEFITIYEKKEGEEIAKFFDKK